MQHALMPRWRTVFMGSPAIAVPALRLLAERSDLRLAITQPDRPAGRGLRPQPPPVKRAAEELGVPVWQPETLRGAEREARLHGHDLFIVMAYGEILRPPVLALPRACVNLHGSLLPRWRGASPLQAALRAGDRESGVSVMQMVPALDAGPVYLAERIPLPEGATLPWLHDAVAEAAARALARFLERWPELTPTPQDEALATYCRRLSDADGCLDWSLPAEEIERWVRAYTPTPGCWTRFDGARVGILEVEVAAGELPPATAVAEDRGLRIGCGRGSVVVRRLQPAGKAAMSARAYLCGHPVPARIG